MSTADIPSMDQDSSSGDSIVSLPSSAIPISKYYKLADFADGVKLGFEQILQMRQRIEQQGLGLMDRELCDVLSVLRFSTLWLGNRYKSVADMVDNLISVYYSGGGLHSLNLGGDMIRDEYLLTPHISIESRRRRALQSRPMPPPPPRLIQEEMLGPLLEELNVDICLLTILEDELGKLGHHQEKTEENPRKSLHTLVLPLTKLTRNMYENVEFLLLVRGIRAAPTDDFSLEPSTDAVEVAMEAMNGELIEYMGMHTWDVFKTMFLKTSSFLY